jgi:integrating conjugative element protein (TIGR03757 family)
MNKVILTLSFMWISGLAQAIEIDLFVNNPSEIVPYKHQEIVIRIHDLSAAERLSEKYLPKQLSAEPEVAKQQALDFFNSPQGTEYKQKIVEAHAYKTLLMKYNVQKTPAIVFDNGKAVIYGMSDIDQGLILYRDYLENNHE